MYTWCTRFKIKSGNIDYITARNLEFLAGQFKRTFKTNIAHHLRRRIRLFFRAILPEKGDSRRIEKTLKYMFPPAPKAKDDSDNEDEDIDIDFDSDANSSDDDDGEAEIEEKDADAE